MIVRLKEYIFIRSNKFYTVPFTVITILALAVLCGGETRAVAVLSSKQQNINKISETRNMGFNSALELPLTLSYSPHESFYDKLYIQYPLEQKDGSQSLSESNNEEEVEEQEEPEIITYTVIEGDTLSKIADIHETTWERIWQKNKELANPDLISVGDVIEIPLKDEELEPRPIEQPQGTNAPALSQATQGVFNSGGSGGANTYAYGYCTWFVKNKRPDLPNNLGNANTWYARYGGAKGNQPIIGAVATTTAGSLGHVAYVEAVHGDGTITISEMNAPVWGVETRRTAHASEFLYLY